MASAFTPVNSRERLPNEVPLIEIDPKGDVYLKLCTTTLRVSSKVLCLASDVFSVMFESENFVEGETLSKKGTCHVPLPGDKSSAMQIACLILHHRTALITEDVTVNSLKDIAVIGDKYACTAALSPWVQVEMTRLLKKPFHYAQDNFDLLYIAHTLDLAADFTEITKRIVFSERKFYDRYSYETDLLPRGVLGEPAPESALSSAATQLNTTYSLLLRDADIIKGIIESHEERIRRGLITKLERLVQTCANCPSCNVRGYLWDLKDASLWPFSTLESRKPLGTILKKLAPLTLKSPDFYACDRCNPRKQKHPACFVKQATLSFKGECLGCFKTSYAGIALSCKNCKTEHLSGSSRKRPRV